MKKELSALVHSISSKSILNNYLFNFQEITDSSKLDFKLEADKICEKKEYKLFKNSIGLILQWLHLINLKIKNESDSHELQNLFQSINEAKRFLKYLQEIKKNKDEIIDITLKSNYTESYKFKHKTKNPNSEFIDSVINTNEKHARKVISLFGEKASQNTNADFTYVALRNKFITQLHQYITNEMTLENRTEEILKSSGLTMDERDDLLFNLCMIAKVDFYDRDKEKYEYSINKQDIKKQIHSATDNVYLKKPYYLLKAPSPR